MLLIALFTQLIVFATAGCSRDHYCRELSGSACRFQTRQESCAQVQGCEWAVRCAARSCLALGTEPECVAQKNCQWSVGGCGETYGLEECDALGEAECGNRAECTWGDACGGTPRPCSNADSAEQCGQIGHCEWVEGTGPVQTF
ncbi:MAG TPA: hypothetical protein VK524_11880 [Polyangiaceae bacterium]|nr:hypothetical protein [Polyangiaceae bacterium]